MGTGSSIQAHRVTRSRSQPRIASGSTLSAWPARRAPTRSAPPRSPSRCCCCTRSRSCSCCRAQSGARSPWRATRWVSTRRWWRPGRLTWQDALRLVRERGLAMAEASSPDQGMSAVLGLADEAVVTAALRGAALEGEVAVVANLNAPGQVVISGHVAAHWIGRGRATEGGRGQAGDPAGGRRRLSLAPDGRGRRPPGRRSMPPRLGDGCPRPSTSTAAPASWRARSAPRCGPS